jgi:hypothetical protein
VPRQPSGCEIYTAISCQVFVSWVLVLFLSFRPYFFVILAVLFLSFRSAAEESAFAFAVVLHPTALENPCQAPKTVENPINPF